MQAPTRDPLLERIQSAAERASSDDALPLREVHAYRAVYSAVRAAPLPRPPAGFAQALAALVADEVERAGLEIWLLRGLLLMLVVGSAFSLAVMSEGLVAQAMELLQRFGATVAAVLAALIAGALIDALFARSQPDSSAPRQG